MCTVESCSGWKWGVYSTFTLLSLTTSSTFSSDCISFSWRQKKTSDKIRRWIAFSFMTPKELFSSLKRVKLKVCFHIICVCKSHSLDKHIIQTFSTAGLLWSWQNEERWIAANERSEQRKEKKKGKILILRILPHEFHTYSTWCCFNGGPR